MKHYLVLTSSLDTLCGIFMYVEGVMKLAIDSSVIN